MCGTRVFCVICIIPMNFEVAFASNVCYRDEHDICHFCAVMWIFLVDVAISSWCSIMLIGKNDLLF